MFPFSGLSLTPRERGWSLGRGWCFIRSPVAADPESHCLDLPEGERRWSRGSQKSRGELSLVPPARRRRRPLGLRIGPAPHPKAANRSRLGKVMLDKIKFHNWLITRLFSSWTGRGYLPKRGTGKQSLKSILPSPLGLCAGSGSTPWAGTLCRAQPPACTHGRQTSFQEPQLNHCWGLTLLLCCGVTPHQ